MNLRGYGEDRLVAELIRNLPTRKDVRVGAGDDCAVIGPARAKRWQLLKTDVVIENVHFLPGEKPHRVGWKALCRAISDIAAMGGEPEHALITVAASPDRTVKYLHNLYEGLRAAAERFGVAIVGGETSSSPSALFLNVALTGSVERKYCVLRSGGKAGHRLYVTGQLGGSIRGKHLDFIPRLEEAQWLVRNTRVRAMMDLSDGLGADLPRLAEASGCGFQLDELSVPRSRGCTLAQAMGDGEDFELLFAIAPSDTAGLESAWRQRFPDLRLTCIGQLTKPSESSTSTDGYDHFA